MAYKIGIWGQSMGMGARRGVKSVVTVGIAVAGLAACGGGNSGSTRAVATQQPNGEASKPAAQILSDTAAALGRIHSFHMQGAGTDLKGAPVTISADFQLPGKLSLTLSDGRQQTAIIVVGSAGYLRANAPVWQAHPSTALAAAQLAGHWLKVPPANADLAQFLAYTNPATIGHCLVESHNGTITVVGISTYHGQPVVILRDRGNLPGTAPGEAYVTTTGPPLVVRLVQTGPARAGGAPDRTCGEKSVSPVVANRDVLRISAYNAPVHITAPQGATTAGALLSASAP